MVAVSLARIGVVATVLVGTGAGAADGSWAYRVQVGDTLIGISQRWLVPGADWRDLRRVNRIANVRRLVPGSVLQVPLALLRQQALMAEVLYTHGEVSVQKSGGAMLGLASGAKLSAGDLVRTGLQSSAALRFADGSRVLLRPGSVLRIERMVRLGDSEAVDTQLRLDEGGTDTRVPKLSSPRFEIRTPVVNLGVRGTEFRTRAEPTRTAVEVIEGIVAGSAGPAAAAAARSIEAGFGALASPTGVASPSPLMAAPDLQAVASRIDRLPLRLSWQAAASGTSYRAQVFDGIESDRLVLDGLFDNPSARWADDLPDGRYRLLVRAVDASGLEGRDASTTFTLKARPEPPFLTRPRAAERSADETVLFAWTRNAASARYRLQVADTPDFIAPRLDRNDIAASEHLMPLPVGTHHWRMASIRADGDMGPWSDAQTVVRIAPPPAPAPQPPQTTDDGVLLMWAGTAGARYQLQVAHDDRFAELLHDERLEAAQWLLRQPEPGRYFVRVRSIDADGFVGPFGAPQQVEVKSSNWWWLLLPAALLLL